MSKERPVVDGIDFDEEVLNKHIAAVKAGKSPSIVTGAQPPNRQNLSGCACQHGRMYKLLGTSPDLNPFQALSLVKGKKDPPPVWAYHGIEDSRLQPEMTSKYVSETKAVFGEVVPVKETSIPGNHGVGVDINRDEGWVKEGLDWLESYWP